MSRTSLNTSTAGRGLVGTRRPGRQWVGLSLVLVVLLSAQLSPEVGYAGIPSGPGGDGVPTTYAPCPMPTPTPEEVGNTFPQELFATLNQAYTRFADVVAANVAAFGQVLGETWELLKEEGSQALELAQELWPVIVIILLGIAAIILLSILFPGVGAAASSIMAVVGPILQALGLGLLADDVVKRVGNALSKLLEGTQEAWFSNGDAGAKASAANKLAKGYAAVLAAIVVAVVSYAIDNPEVVIAKISGPIKALAGEEKCNTITRILRGVGCFVAGTPVLMADGTFKPIEQVKYGEWVLSKDEASGKVEARQVTATSVRQHVLTMVITFEDRSTLETTQEHPLYVEGQGFEKAGAVGIGTAIATRAGPGLLVTGIKRDVRATTVYNFTVEVFHTYFVGNNALWVHNTCLVIDDGQLGIKWGRHKREFPSNWTHVDYRNRINAMFNNPALARHSYPTNSPIYPGETHIVDGDDLLRIAPDGTFRSLYKGSQTTYPNGFPPPP